MGKREENKQATRAALRAAADRLFEERGFAATTVRDIAQAAGVTERTFFRYFESKEDLLLEEALGWLPVFQDAIRARPAGEPPLIAVREGLRAAVAQSAASPRPTLLWMYSSGPPMERLRSPAVLLRIEQAVADALASRVDDAFRAEVLARVAVALVRSALLHAHATGRLAPELVDEAFALVSDQADAVR